MAVMSSTMEPKDEDVVVAEESPDNDESETSLKPFDFETLPVPSVGMMRREINRSEQLHQLIVYPVLLDDVLLLRSCIDDCTHYSVKFQRESDGIFNGCLRLNFARKEDVSVRAEDIKAAIKHDVKVQAAVEFIHTPDTMSLRNMVHHDIHRLLYIGNLPTSATETALGEIFTNAFVMIACDNDNASLGYAYAAYGSTLEAEQAVEKHCMVARLGGHLLAVELMSKLMDDLTGAERENLEKRKRTLQTALAVIQDKNKDIAVELQRKINIISLKLNKPPRPGRHAHQQPTTPKGSTPKRSESTPKGPSSTPKGTAKPAGSTPKAATTPNAGRQQLKTAKTVHLTGAQIGLQKTKATLQAALAVIQDKNQDVALKLQQKISVIDKQLQETPAKQPPQKAKPATTKPQFATPKTPKEAKTPTSAAKKPVSTPGTPNTGILPNDQVDALERKKETLTTALSVISDDKATAELKNKLAVITFRLKRHYDLKAKPAVKTATSTPAPKTPGSQSAKRRRSSNSTSRRGPAKVQKLNPATPVPRVRKSNAVQPTRGNQARTPQANQPRGGNIRNRGPRRAPLQVRASNMAATTKRSSQAQKLLRNAVMMSKSAQNVPERAPRRANEPRSRRPQPLSRREELRPRRAEPRSRRDEPRSVESRSRTDVRDRSYESARRHDFGPQPMDYPLVHPLMGDVDFGAQPFVNPIQLQQPLIAQLPPQLAALQQQQQQQQKQQQLQQQQLQQQQVQQEKLQRQLEIQQREQQQREQQHERQQHERQQQERQQQERQRQQQRQQQQQQQPFVPPQMQLQSPPQFYPGPQPFAKNTSTDHGYREPRRSREGHDPSRFDQKLDGAIDTLVGINSLLMSNAPPRDQKPRSRPVIDEKRPAHDLENYFASQRNFSEGRRH